MLLTLLNITFNFLLFKKSKNILPFKKKRKKKFYYIFFVILIYIILFSLCVILRFIYLLFKI